MRDYIHISPAPVEEECEQVGSNCDYGKMKRECNVFIGQLRRVFGPEPEGAQLAVKKEAHDFGSYYDVVCYYNDDNEQSIEYAFKCESDTPTHWDAEALRELEGSR